MKQNQTLTTEEGVPDEPWPGWLVDATSLPASFECPVMLTDYAPLRLVGHDAPLPPHAVERVLTACCTDAFLYRNDEERHAQIVRAHRGLMHARQGLDADSSDAFWLSAWTRTFAHAEDRTKHRFLSALRHFGHEHTILFVGDLLGTTSKHLGEPKYGALNAASGLFHTHEPLAYEQLAHAMITMSSAKGREGLDAIERFGLKEHFDAYDRANFLSEHFPEYGLNAHAERTLDYCSRSFTLFLNMNCELTVRDAETGKTRGSLPRPKKGEDADRVMLLVEDFARQKKRIKRMRDVITRRLERDLVLMTPRTLPEFTAFFETSPLHRRICSMLLWGIYDTDHRLVAAFRPDIEGNRLDADYEPVTQRVTSTRTIALVHPLDLDDLQRAAWSEHFADGEVVPPFPQLDRKCVSPAEWEAEKAWHETIPRFEDVSIALRKLPGWFADYTQKARNTPKAWMATWHPEVLGLYLRFIHEARTWDEGSGPARGLFITTAYRTLSTDEVVPWEDVPARFVSEALCDIERAYEKVHGALRI